LSQMAPAPATGWASARSPRALPDRAGFPTGSQAIGAGIDWIEDPRRVT
jgi:hypothetical protein